MKKISKKSTKNIKRSMGMVVKGPARMARKSVAKIKPLDVAKGAAVISAVSGVVAAGAALSDKKTRSKLGKTVKKGIEKAQDIASTMGEQAQQMPTIAHQLGVGKSSKKKKRSE